MNLNIILRDLRGFFLILLAFVMPFHIHLVSVSVICWSFVSLLYFLLNPKTLSKNNVFLFFLFSSLFFIQLISLFYSKNLESGWGLMEKRLSLLIFPLVFFIFYQKIKKTLLEIALLFFLISNFLLGLSIPIYFIFKGYWGRFYYSETSSSFFIREEFERISNVHPTYLSIYFLFSAFLLLYALLSNFEKLNWIYKIILLMLAALFFFLTTLLVSRTPSIAFCVAIFFFLLLYIKTSKWKWLYILIMMMTCSLLLITPTIKERFKELYLTEFVPPQDSYTTSSNIRVGILICTYDLLYKNWLFGVGIADVQNELNKCYNSFNTDAYKIRSYNTHNQFFDFWLASGILALIIFLLNLLIPLILALRKNALIYVFFVIFIAICCLTENILVRQKGVIFYSYFNCLLILYFRKETK